MPYTLKDVTIANDGVELYLECECGDRICAVEEGDNFTDLLSMARMHARRHNQRGETHN